MPSSESRYVFHGEKPGSRPKCVFDKRSSALQSFRTLELANLSSPDREENIDDLRSLAAEARADFERELERRTADAERRGREVGMQEAAAVHAEERDKLVERMEGAMQALHRTLDRAEEHAARDALRLGLMVAERIARKTLVSDADALSKNLVSAAGQLGGANDLKVVAPPDVAALLDANTKDILQELGSESFEVEADPTLQPGDFMVFRGSTSMDGRVASRLRKMERALFQELGYAGDEEEE